jgi:hypothetical protein
MLKLDILAPLRQEFATVEALWQSTAETRRVDALILSWVKHEKQLRRLFCFLVYQHPKITEVNITAVVDALAKNRELYPETFIGAIKALGVEPVPALVGQRHAELAAELARIKKYRNKLIHGQVTGQSIQSHQLERDVQFLVQWVAALAAGADAAFGYNGLRRNTYRAAKAKANIAVAAFPFTTPAEFKAWLNGLPRGG